MPVPVPYHPKPPTHRVIKPLHPTSAQTKLRLLTSDAQPLPSLAFGAREDRLSTLSWRREESHSIWEGATHRQDFHKGLAAADNASAIKGTHAEACIPPMYKLIEASQPVGGPVGRFNRMKPEPGVEESGSDDSSIYDTGARWGGRSYLAHPTISQDQPRHVTGYPPTATPSLGLDHQQWFAPILDDHSPGSASGPDSGSSPLEPITPFADFVDRVVAAGHYPPSGGDDSMAIDCSHDSQSNIVPDAYHIPQAFPIIIEQPRHMDQIPDTVVPTASCGYKKLAAPLSEWVANYVWKVCTTGFSLPPSFVQSASNVGHYPVFPPSFLAPSINSVLLSTLLQPSAVLLAIWYIVRLPVFFGDMPLAGEFAKEKSFRTALMGDAFQVDSSEANAPFRLVILGFMLANKWLDDHTFSNKTWHSISNISIQTLNSLESIVLDIFNYDLSISSQQWSQWLVHVTSYHLSLTSTVHPQPISRPSSNPHSIVRKAIEDIMQAPAACGSDCGVPQPIFLGLEDRLKERMEREKAMDVLEIDLDEDGPLREEYLPKRRTSALAPSGSHTSGVTRDNSEKHDWDLSKVPVIKQLPPPAKWSPAGDEPILRDKNRGSGQYVAVRGPHPSAATHPTYQPQNIGYNQNWNPYLSTKLQSGYTYDVPSIIRVDQPSYTPLGHVASLAIPHSRSQSLSYGQDNMLLRNHMRSFSQARFNYSNDIRMAANELISNNVEPRWMDPTVRYPYHGSTFVPVPVVGLQPAW